MLKDAANGSFIMMYMGQKIGIPLPNPGLYLYTTHCLLVLPSIAVGDRSASARIAHDTPMHYYNMDTAPEGPTYTAVGW